MFQTKPSQFGKVPQEELARILGNTVPARKTLPKECNKKAWLCCLLPEKRDFSEFSFQNEVATL